MNGIVKAPVCKFKVGAKAAAAIPGCMGLHVEEQPQVVVFRFDFTCGERRWSCAQTTSPRVMDLMGEARCVEVIVEAVLRARGQHNLLNGG
jgi:hypothetical protein